MTKQQRPVRDVQLLHFDECPNWRLMSERLEEAVRLVDADVRVTRTKVTSPDEAERLAFRGSPTVLVDGVDPFAEPGDPVGLSCRVFRTPDGLSGAPTVDQLAAVLG